LARQIAIPCSDCGRRFGGQDTFDRHLFNAGDRWRCRAFSELGPRGFWEDRYGVWHRGPNPLQTSLLERERPGETVPAHTLVRVSDPDTSHLAAQALSGKAGTMRRRILKVYANGAELTAEEAAFNAGFGPADGPWKRISDLLNAGLLEDTGERRKAHSGRLQRVLRVSEAGRRALLGVAS
jgi:hypothetical protein